MAAQGETVLVTGASGYIATHVVQQLQQAGYRVRGTVRSLKNEEKVKPIRELCPGAKYPVELVEAELLDSKCWAETVKGCTYVCHTASPFPSVVVQDENDLIGPAVEGTLNVLRACAEVKGVKRVVLTSSTASISGGLSGKHGYLYTEEDWTDVTDPNITPYPKSKSKAEKAAWDFVKGLPKEKAFELAVVNPSFVMGPVLCGSFSTSMALPKRLLEREISMVAEVNFPVVDVRDVAKGHIMAMTKPSAAGNRHILVGENKWFLEIAKILSKEFAPQGYNVPLKTAWWWVVRLGGMFDPQLKLAADGLGVVTTFNAARMKNILDITPTPVEDTLIDMAYSMIESGKIKKTPQYKGRQ